MSRAILRFGEDVMLSFVSGEQLAMAKSFKIHTGLLDELFSEMQPYSFERLDIVFKPQIVDFTVDSHFVLRKIGHGPKERFAVVNGKDFSAVESLYKTLGIPKVVAHSTLDFHRHTSNELSVILDPHYKGEVLACLLDGSDIIEVQVMPTSNLEKYVKGVMQSYGEIKIRNVSDGVSVLSWGLKNLHEIPEATRETLGDSLFVLERSSGIDLANSLEDSQSLDSLESVVFDELSASLEVEDATSRPPAPLLDSLNGNPEIDLKEGISLEPEDRLVVESGLEKKAKLGKSIKPSKKSRVESLEEDAPKLRKKKEKKESRAEPSGLPKVTRENVRKEELDRPIEVTQDEAYEELGRVKGFLDTLGFSLVVALGLFILFLIFMGKFFFDKDDGVSTAGQGKYYSQLASTLESLNSIYSSDPSMLATTYKDVVSTVNSSNSGIKLYDFVFEGGNFSIDFYTPTEISPEVLKSLVPPGRTIVDIQTLGSGTSSGASGIKSKIIFK